MSPQSARFKTALTGTFSLLFSAAMVPAASTWSGEVDIAIPTNFAGVYLDLDAGGETPSTPYSDPGTAGSYTVGYNAPATWDVNFFFNGIGIAYSDTFQPARSDGGDNLSRILNVEEGVTVDSLVTYLGVDGANASFGGSGQANNSSVGESHFDDVLDGYFKPAQSGYIAFVLNPEDATPQYGWMEVTLRNDGSTSPSGEIHQWAFSDSPAFTVGQIPEPGTVALLLVGACLLHRRRV